MASRLSELSVKTSYHQGHVALPWDAPAAGVNLIKVDLEKVLASAQPEGLIQSLPPQLLYHSIKEAGIENSGDVIRLLSNDQFTRILDYDVWSGEKLQPKQLCSWLAPLRQQGPIAIARRFSALEEEYQLATFDKAIQIYDAEEYDRLPDAVRTALNGVPGGEFYYEIKTQDPELYDALSDIVDSAMAYDVKYAMSLLSHAAYIPPNESEFALQQFRKARLEEDGFMTSDESQEAFLPLDLERLRRLWSVSSKQAEIRPSLIPQGGQDESFVERVVYYALEQDAWTDEDGLRFQQGSLYLANCLCSASNIDPSDMEGVNRLLEQAKALMGLGLEYLTDGDLGRAVTCLKTEYPRQLFRAGLSLVYASQEKVIERLRTLLGMPTAEKLRKLVAGQKWGEAQWFVDVHLQEVLGLQAAEALKGLLNRFPMRPVFKEEHGVDVIRFAPIGSMVVYKRMQEALDHLLTDVGVRH